ncbi:MAG: peptidylprolyl isomerase [Candidatus Pacearchaeota archaeon]
MLVLVILNMKQNPKVKIETSMGEIVVELYPSKAPISVKNFLSYVDEGFYDGTVFHRVILDFMIQGGGFNEAGEQKKTKSPIKLESNNGLKNEIGSIAMARTNQLDSATSQFFINTADNDFLNYGYRDEGYAVFGKVVEGYDVVEEIENSETTIKFGMGDWPVEEVLIKSIKRVK